MLVLVRAAAFALALVLPALVLPALVLLALVLPFPSDAADAERGARTWRPATAIEVARIVDAHREAATRPVPRPIATPPAQRAYIDPVTNELVSSPVVPPEPEDDAAQRALQAPMTLKRNAAGFYHLDTRDYQMRATATLDASGAVHKGCVDPSHDAEPATAPATAREPQR